MKVKTVRPNPGGLLAIYGNPKPKGKTKMSTRKRSTATRRRRRTTYRKRSNPNPARRRYASRGRKRSVARRRNPGVRGIPIQDIAIQGLATVAGMVLTNRLTALAMKDKASSPAGAGAQIVMGVGAYLLLKKTGARKAAMPFAVGAAVGSLMKVGRSVPQIAGLLSEAPNLYDEYQMGALGAGMFNPSESVAVNALSRGSVGAFGYF